MQQTVAAALAKMEYIEPPFEESLSSPISELSLTFTTPMSELSLAFIDTDIEDDEGLSLLSSQNATPTWESPEPSSKRSRLLHASSLASSLNLAFSDFAVPTAPSNISSPAVSDTASDCGPELREREPLRTNKCCEHRCLSYISLYNLQEMRSVFQSKSRRDQRQFILDLLSSSGPHTDVQHLRLPLMGRDMCASAFTQVLGTSRRRLREARQLYLSGCFAAPLSQRLPGKKSEKHSNAVAWMSRYFGMIGDKMPHINQIHLPHFLSKQAVYQLMIQDLAEEGITRVLSLSHFYAVWEAEFINVTIPKVPGIWLLVIRV